MANGEIAHDEQILILPQYFQLYSINMLSVIDIFHIFAKTVSMASVANLLYVGKGQTDVKHKMKDVLAIS